MHAERHLLLLLSVLVEDAHFGIAAPGDYLLTTLQ